MAFQGFPQEGLDFFVGLIEDNSKAYWQANKPVYERAVAEPVRLLAEALAPEFGEAKIFRPYRDVRFSADNTPYQEHASFAAWGGTGGLYCQISPDGVYVAGGWYQPDAEALARFREAISEPAVAEVFDTKVKTLVGQGFEFGGNDLKTVPRGYDRDHPRVDLLRHRTLVFSQNLGLPAWVHTKKCQAEVQKRWRQIESWNAWLAEHTT